MFKVILLTATIVFCALAQNSIVTERQKAVTECVAAQPTEKNFKNYRNTPINRACVKKCISEKLGFTDSSGNPIESSYDEKELGFVKKCDEDTKKHDPCNRVDAFEICLEDKRKEQRQLISRQCQENSDYLDLSKPYLLRVACFRKCVAIKNGLLMEDGEIDVKGVKKIVGEGENVDDLIEKCRKDFDASSGCQKSMDVMRCVIQKAGDENGIY